MRDDDFLELAPVLGLDALGPAEMDSVRRRLAAADEETRTEFEATVRGTREAMARVSETTALAPPAGLRDRILAAAAAEPIDEPETPVDDDASAGVTELRPRGGGSGDGRRFTYMAAAAVVAIAVGAVGWILGVRMNEEGTPSMSPTESVFAAGDVQSSSGDVATGRATLTFSESADAAVLVMNDVPPPQEGTVYQMWLDGPDGMRSAGTMAPDDVAPSTTAVITGLDGVRALAFTVEPPGGSEQPTGDIVASLSLQ